ncbi:MAG: hypothetical protein LBE21_01925, partial [Pseudomonadales bacterium]|nr:hypothetical protein [Pseudomonadales bacterium]
MNAATSTQSPTRPGLLRRLGWWLLRLCFALLLLVTLYLSAGRLLLPRLASQSTRIEAELTRLLQVPVHIEGLQGSWRGATPWLDVAALSVQAPDGAPQRIENLRFAVDVWSSVRQRQLVIASLVIGAVELELQEMPDGRWALAGLPAGQGAFAAQLQRFLLNTPHLSLAGSRLVLRPAVGQPLSLRALAVEIENSGPLHRARLQFQLDEQPSLSQVALELHQMPDTGWSGHGWAQLPALDLRALLQARLPAWQVAQARVSSEWWFDFDAAGALSLSARLRDAQLSAQEPVRGLRVPLQQGRVDLRAERQSSGAWDLQLRDLAFIWEQTPWLLPALRLSQSDPEAPALLLQAASVDLTLLSTLALDATPLPESGATVLRTLAPQGVLRNVRVETRSDGSYPGYFQVRANLENGAVQPWNSAPAGGNLSAYIEASALSGMAEVDSRDFTLHLPKMFADPWRYEQVNGRINWQVADGEVRVHSDLLDVHDADLDARVGFALLNQRFEDGTRESSLKLLVGVERMAVAPGKVYLPTLPRLAPTMDWLRTALQGGELSDSGFLLRQQRRNGVDVSTSVQSWYQVNGGNLRFAKDWQPLENAQATITVRDGATDAIGRAGGIDGVTLQSATARIRRDELGGSWLALDGKATSGSAAGWRFLLNSPLHQVLGSTFDTWQTSGRLDTTLSLGLPLGGNPRERLIEVDVRSQDSTLSIPEYALYFSGVDGVLKYSAQGGLSASAMQAQLFGETLRADIESARLPEGGRRTRIAGNGRAKVENLRAWERMPNFVKGILDYAEGELDYQLALEFPGAGAGARLNLNSDLQGTALSLPAPFAKTASEGHQLALDYAFGKAGAQGDRSDLLTLRFDDIISGTLTLDARGLERGQLYFGALNRDFTVRQADAHAAGLLVSGELDSFDFDAWRAVARSVMQRGNGTGRTLEETLRLVDVNVDELSLFGQRLEDINVQVQPGEGGWRIQGHNALLSGRLALHQAAPWQVELDYLRLPPRPELTPQEARAAAEVDLLAKVDPIALPAFDFNSAQISVGADNLGQLSFTYRPYTAGARIEDFRLQSPQSSVLGLDASGGASIDWSYRGGELQSSFSGLVTATDLARVLPSWGQAAFLSSQNARFEAELSWPGSPLAFKLKRSSGA